MTWWLWLVLVLGALLLYALIGLRLWRRGKTLLGELTALERLTAPLQEAAGRQPEPLTFTPGFLTGPGALAALREQRRTNIATRRSRRRERAVEARERWNRIGLR